MTSDAAPGSDAWPLSPSARQKGSSYTTIVFASGPATALRYKVARSSGSTGSKTISSASAGGTATMARPAAAVMPPASTSTWSLRWVIVRAGALSRTALPSCSAIRIAIEPAPPSTRFSCAPFSIEKSVLMLPWPRTSISRLRKDTSLRSPAKRPRIAMSKRSRAIEVRIPVRSRYQTSERWSHSFAFSAVQGASSGTFFARRSSRS